MMYISFIPFKELVGSIITWEMGQIYEEAVRGRTF
jgi:hypothetical protein